MKKLSIALLAIIMILSLAACGNTGKETTADPAQTPAQTQAPATNAPATNAPETKAPATNAPATDPVVTEPVTKSVNEILREAIPGIWQITAWDLVQGGYVNVVESWFLKYTDDTIWFYQDGELINEEGYEWKDDITMHFWYKADPSYVGDWAYELKDDGTLVITYAEYGVVYYCEKRPDDTDPLAYKPSQSQENIGKAIAPTELVGIWDLNSMTVAGVETPLAGQMQTFVFTEDSVQYVIAGVPINDSTYVFADEYNLTITSKADTSNVANWNLALQEDGSLIITDTTNGWIYNCSKQN